MERMPIFQHLGCVNKAVERIPVLSPFDHDVASLPQSPAKERYFAQLLFCHKSEVELHNTKKQRYVGHASMVADDEIVLVGAVILLTDHFNGYTKKPGAQPPPPCGYCIEAFARGVEEGKQEDQQYPEKRDCIRIKRNISVLKFISSSYRVTGRVR